MTLVRPLVCHFITSLSPGGAERQLSLTLPHLSSFRHMVIGLKHWGSVGEELRQKKFPVFNLNASHFFDRKAIHTYRNLLKEHKPDILITYLLEADMWGRLYSPFSLKKICFLRASLKEFHYFPFLILNNITHPLVDRFFSVSHAVKDYYVKFGLPSLKIKPITNGIDLSFFHRKQPCLKKIAFLL